MSVSCLSVDDLFTEWRAAFQRKDIVAILSMLTDDYLLWAPATPPIGIDMLRPRLENAFAAYDVEPGYESEERIVSGDLAFERGWDTQEVRPRAGGDAIVQRQRVFMVLRRAADGRWQFARGMSHAGPAA